MSYFSNAGWRDIHGIDPAPRAGEIARMLFQISTVAQGSMLDAASRTPLGVADLVCLTAVLEHLPTMRDHIDALVGQMKHGALLLVEVPALEAFDGDVGEPFGEFSLEHIQFFSRHSLEAFFASLGARLTAHCMVELPAMVGASHFALFQIGGAADSLKFIRLEADRATIERYVQNSQRRLIEAVKSVPDRPYFIYGAGSHTARLLPAVDDLCPRAGAILAIADGNRNLIGKSIGGHLIQGKEVFLSDRAAPILISSFRSQSDIAQQLRGNVPNPLVLLYPEQMGLE